MEGQKMKYTVMNENHMFRRVYRHGNSYISPTLVCYVMKNKREKRSLYGITSSKKIGCAVKRNRARRVIRAAYRELAPQLKTGYCLVFVARTRTAYVKMWSVKREMREQLLKAGVLDSEKTHN